MLLRSTSRDSFRVASRNPWQLAQACVGTAGPRLHLPDEERICREVQSVPMSVENTPEQVDYTVRSVTEYFSLPLRQPVLEAADI